MHDEADEHLAWELATESIVVNIRWFGIFVGYALVQSRVELLRDPWAVRAILALGAGYAALDTIYYRMGVVFLKRWPLFVSGMEATFIALLCFHDVGLESPFRWYYSLSAICCAVRYRPTIAWTAFALQCLSLVGLTWALSPTRPDLNGLALTLVILAWATWATSALANLLTATSDRLERANADLEHHRAELERRVAERSAALRASQARVIHQEKMAAFWLLSAGIAHEVGNPLAALSSLVQMLQRRGPDPYTAEKLDLAHRQLGRIQRTIRELIDFSRPALSTEGPIRLAEVVNEALGIAKYYHRTKDRRITTNVQADLPPIRAPRDRLIQILFNLVLNAIDATDKGGKIHLEGRFQDGWIELRALDNGRGIASDDLDRLFQPYFTTKPQGTGLGLFVSRQIVEELGGTLTYHPAPDQGSAFTVRLPAAPGEPKGLDNIQMVKSHRIDSESTSEPAVVEISTLTDPNP
ncbi:MAG: ATP-binding protein [Isosphaeraceae bacterium]